LERDRGLHPHPDGRPRIDQDAFFTWLALPQAGYRPPSDIEHPPVTSNIEERLRAASLRTLSNGGGKPIEKVRQTPS